MSKSISSLLSDEFPKVRKRILYRKYKIVPLRSNWALTLGIRVPLWIASMPCGLAFAETEKIEISGWYCAGEKCTHIVITLKPSKSLICSCLCNHVLYWSIEETGRLLVSKKIDKSGISRAIKGSWRTIWKATVFSRICASYMTVWWHVWKEGFFRY